MDLTVRMSMRDCLEFHLLIFCTFSEYSRGSNSKNIIFERGYVPWSKGMSFSMSLSF